MRRTSVLVTLAALVGALLPVVATTTARAVTEVAYDAAFEATDPGLSVGAQVTNQYSFVTFGAPGAGWTLGWGSPDNAKISPNGTENPYVVAGHQHGGSDAGEVACPSEFCKSATFGSLNVSADSISVWAGDESTGGAPVELDAYDASKTYLGNATATTGSTGASTQLSYTAPAGQSIAYFVVYLTTGNAHYLDVDDLHVTAPSTAPAFVGVSADFSSYEIGQGGSRDITLHVQRTNDPGASVSLHVDGATATLHAPDPGATTGDATLSISADMAAPVGDVPLTITASAGGATSLTPLQLTIQVVAPLSFTAVDPKTLQPCQNATFSLDAQVAPGEPGGSVAFSTSFDPTESSMSASLEQASVPITGGVATANVRVDNTGDGSLTDLRITAQLSNGTSATKDVAIYPAPPSITSVNAIGLGQSGQPVSTTKAVTPRAEGPGSTLEVFGHGFCDSATLAVGNPKATVTGTVQHLSNGQGPYDYLRVTTPRLATSGPVTVTAGAPAGTSAPSSTSLTVDSYRNTDGYSFVNFNPNITFDDFTEAFGEKQTYVEMDACGFLTLGLAHCAVKIVPDPTAEIWVAEAINSLQAGTCFGFSLSSQRILEQITALSSLPGSPASIHAAKAPDTSDFAQANHGTDALLDLLKADHVMQFSTEFMTDWLAEDGLMNAAGSKATGMIVGQIHDVFAAGHYPLITLQDSGGGGGHVVVAYDMVQTTPGAYDIYVYDSNKPFTSDEDSGDGSTHQSNLSDSVIHLAADATWTLASTTDSSGAWHGGGGSLLVFDPDTVPAHPHLASIGGGAPDGALFSSTSGGSSSATVAQVSDGGKTLFTSTGAPNTDPATRLDGGGFGPFVASGSASSTPPAIVLGSSVRTPTVVLTGTRSGTGSLTFAQGGYAGSIVTGVSSGAHRTVGFSSRTGAVTLADASSGRTTLTVSRTGAGAAHTAAATFAQSGGGDGLALSTGAGGITLTHIGAPTTVSVVLSGTQPNGVPGTFSTGPITIGAGQTAKIGAIHWGSLAKSTVTVRTGGRTLVVHNHAAAPPTARITRVSVKRLAKHKVTLSVRAALPALTKGSAVSVLFLVRRGNQVVAKHVVAASSAHRALSASWTTALPAGAVLTCTALVVTSTVRGGATAVGLASRSTHVTLH